MAYGMRFAGRLTFADAAARERALAGLEAVADGLLAREATRVEGLAVALELEAYAPATSYHATLAQLHALAEPASGGHVDASFFAGDDEERIRYLAGGHALDGEGASRAEPRPTPPPPPPAPPRGFLRTHRIEAAGDGDLGGPAAVLEALARAFAGLGCATSSSPFGGPIARLAVTLGSHAERPDLELAADGGAIEVRSWIPAPRGRPALRKLRAAIGRAEKAGLACALGELDEPGE